MKLSSNHGLFRDRIMIPNDRQVLTRMDPRKAKRRQANASDAQQAMRRAIKALLKIERGLA